MNAEDLQTAWGDGRRSAGAVVWTLAAVLIVALILALAHRRVR